MKALLVDDEPGVLKVLGKSVERLGYSCLLAPAAGEALEAFSHGPFELIVTDLLMPGMHGLEFILRARRVMPEAAIVVVTALDGLKTSLEALKRGADEYVVKPFGIRQIDCAVMRARERRHRLATLEKDTRRFVERERRSRGVESAMIQLVERTAHDLRNHLAVIRAHVEFLGLFRRGEDVRRALDACDGTLSGIQQATYIQRLGTLQHGEMLEDVDLNTIVEEEIRLAARRSGRAIARDAGLDLPAIAAEPELLRKVVRELLWHALERSAPRGKVFVRTRFVPQAEEVIALVCHNGPRMSPDEEIRLLGRLGHGKTMVSLCREVIRAHGGRLWIEPDRRKNTTLVLALPSGPLDDSTDLDIFDQLEVGPGTKQEEER